jgi:putative acetyltransferase
MYNTTMNREPNIREVRQACRQMVRELGLVGPRHPSMPCTPTGGHIILELHGNGSLRLPELADLLRLDRTTVCRALASLRKRKLASETVDPEDRRVKWFRLTKAGESLATQLHAHADNQVGAALGLLTQAEREQLVKSVYRYCEALRKTRRAAECEICLISRRDNAPMLNVLRQIRIEFGALPSGFPVEEPGESDLFRLYSRRDSRYFVAFARAEVVGGAGVAPLQGGRKGYCELQRMYLLPAARGLGIGRQLFVACINAAQEMGYSHCYLETVQGMHDAIRLYKRFGFRRLSSPLGATGHTHTDQWFILNLKRTDLTPGD